MEAKYEAYTESKNIQVNASAYELALEKVSTLVGTDSLRPVSLATALESLPGSSSAGYPYLKQRSKAAQFISLDAKTLKKNIEQRSKDLRVFPCMSSSRRVIRKKPDNKPRLVWCYPGAVSNVEQTFALPLSHFTSRFKQHGTSVQWLSQFKWFTQLRCKQQRHIIISLDYAGFDSSVPAFIIRDAFGILSDLFDLSGKEYLVWQFIVNYFVHTPLMMYGSVRQKHRGIPSGSCFTSIIGTICNMIISYYTSYLADFTIDQHTSKWLGDDSRINILEHYSGNINHIKEEFEASASHFGMCIHPEKCDCVLSTNEELELGTFLSRRIHWDYPQLRFDVTKFYGQILIPERQDKIAGDTLDRLIGLTYAYGFQRKPYNLLHSCYEYVVSRWQDSTPSFNDRVINDFNRMLHCEFNRETWRFPTFERIHELYFGYN